tara:strand:+ start:2357 stop:3004 length:648 start_codon:yes stop_codon:yes gene_type:complete
MILGLDLSTRLVGVAILSDPKTRIVTYNGNEIEKVERELLDTYLWDIKDKKEYPDVYTKVEAIAAELYQLSHQYNIKHIYVEDYVRGVQHSFKNNMNVLLALARFNGLICWHCYEIFGIKPQLANVAKTRTTYGLSFPRGTRSAARKKMVVEKVIEKEGEKFQWSFNRNGVNYATGVEDRADAVVVARYGEFMERNKNNSGILTTKMKIDNLQST